MITKNTLKFLRTAKMNILENKHNRQMAEASDERKSLIMDRDVEREKEEPDFNVIKEIAKQIYKGFKGIF